MKYNIHYIVQVSLFKAKEEKSNVFIGEVVDVFKLEKVEANTEDEAIDAICDAHGEENVKHIISVTPIN